VSRLALTRRLVMVGGASLLAAPAAFAHRAQSCFTTIEWNAHASTLEVVHRLHGHDAEVALVQQAGAAGDDVDITKVRNQARTAIYIEQRFKLKAGGAEIPLGVVGAEMQDDSVWLYREARMAAAPASLTIEDGILRDVFQNQSNMVNIRIGPRVHSLIFAGDDRVKTADGLL
jgi:hypothetical protein